MAIEHEYRHRFVCDNCGNTSPWEQTVFEDESPWRQIQTFKFKKDTPKSLGGWEKDSERILMCPNCLEALNSFLRKNLI